ncbi:MAG: hypothetical protein QNK34_16215 [Woeseiaceae bacterium]|nr:hypothetical protein [Woeseiaceae bacterium]
MGEPTGSRPDHFGDPRKLRPENISLKTLLRVSLQRGDRHQVSRYTLVSQRATDTFQIDFPDLLLELGAEFQEQNDVDSASFNYQVGLYFYPEHEKLLAALKGVESL